MVVLPEPEGKFSANFLMPMEGPGSFDALKASGTLIDYFKNNFRELYDAIPDFED